MLFMQPFGRIGKREKEMERDTGIETAVCPVLFEYCLETQRRGILWYVSSQCVAISF